MSVRVKFGSEATDELKNLVSNAKDELFIVSPWLSSSTVRTAIKKQKDGVNVDIITTSSDNDHASHRNALNRLVEKRQRVKRSERRALTASGLTLVLSGFLGLIATSLAGALDELIMIGMIAALLTGVALYFAGRESLEDYWASKVHSVVMMGVEPLMHMKIYVVDDVLAIGSPNYTYYGLNRNVEALAFIKDREVAKKTKGDVVSVLEKYNPRFISADDRGEVNASR